MTLSLQKTGLRSVLFAVMLGSAALVHAAAGFTVNAAQQAAVKVGMSRDEVRALLGRPAHNFKYLPEPGRTWTYGVIAASSDSATSGSAGNKTTVFDVDFSAEGRVLSTGQRVEMMN